MSGGRAWLEPVGRGGLHAAHLCWWCWGVEHFAAMACYWLVQSHTERLTLCAAAPLGYLEALDSALSRFPEVRRACRRVELGPSGWAAALGEGQGVGARVMVIAAPVLFAVASVGASGPAGLEELRQMETAVHGLARGGSTVLCAYDVKALSAADDGPARAVVELALSQHPRVLAAGKVVCPGGC